MPNLVSSSLALVLLLAAAPGAFAQEAAPPADAAAQPAAETPVNDAPQADADDGVAETDAAADVEALSPLVADVQVLGPWTDGDRRGIWRTVMLQPQGEGSGNRFFVQQIEEVDGAPAVSSSVEITEIGEMNGAVVSYRPDEPSEAQPELLTLFMDIVPLDGEIAETYELFYTAGEPYTFGPASN
ncbi:hypothetical protein [Aureimonas mangrovi]|uniref:hypothetical protein n=1 Tax=Aureimonas mangrovi TaxID=2758041 RepID=UPI00163D680F|nr:hypothetical protein [Aureimonas mangrovi]